MNGSQIQLTRSNEVQNSVDFMPLLGLVRCGLGVVGRQVTMAVLFPN